MRQIELLAPAKDLATLKAAVDYGADAVYIGASRFGARHAATNSIDEIAQGVEYAHQFGVRVHATLNTILFDNELEEAKAQAEKIIATGVDALIIQDMAYTQMGLQAELHASTQCGNRTVERTKFLDESGFSRIILERGLTLEQIRNICNSTSCEVECFVHGAICVGYSGECYLSRTTSPRSGNRGECSQPCRLSYDLVDESGRTIIKQKHLLSVRDLNLTERLEELIDAGICSMKIEGRLKEISYVKNVVAHYRKALDTIIARRSDLCRSSIGATTLDFEPNPSKSFTRGESHYMIDGVTNQVASFDTPKAVGEYLGRVTKLTPRGFQLDRKIEINTGDGLSFEGTGTNVIKADGAIITPNKTDGLQIGSKIYRNYDRIFTQQLEKSRTRRTIDTTAQITINQHNIELIYKNSDNIEATTSIQVELKATHNIEKMDQTTKIQLTRSGDTIFNVTEVDVKNEGWFVPSSQLSDLKRTTLEKLRKARIAKHREHNIFEENRDTKLESATVAPNRNVTNRLSRSFYTNHQAQNIESGLDTQTNLQGKEVLRSSYCIRREIGECLKQNTKLKGKLYLTRGNTRYEIACHCKTCEMSLILANRS